MRLETRAILTAVAITAFFVGATLPFSPAVSQAPALIQAPQPKAKQQKKYATGRIEPKNIKALRAISDAVYGRMLRALPNVTTVTWDCRNLGIVPPIVDQGQCGSCWDFSGTSVATSSFMLSLGTNAPGPLSEQYTLDCGQNGGCNGDDNTTVLTWAKATGLPTTSSYGPYKGGAGQCKTGVTLYKISDWGYCDGSQGNGVTSAQLIKNAMVKYGPIGAAIAADDAFMNNPAGQVFMGSGSTSIDHDIVLVGWDDTKANGKGAWILRNSWGTSWCDGGYCWIAYGANLVGTEAVWAVSAGGPIPPPAPPPGPPTPPPGPAPAGAPVISSPASDTAPVGVAYTYQITATNSPVLFDAMNLPPGFSCSQVGLITGTPAMAGSATITLVAANTSGASTATLQLTMGVTPPPVNAVSVTLTADQIASVLSQSSAIVVTEDVTLKQLSDIMTKSKSAKYPTNSEPPVAK